MNILFIDQFSELGGGQRCLLEIIEEITSRGWRATIALPGDGPFADVVRRSAVEVIHVPCGPYRSGRKTLRDLLRFGRDVIEQYKQLRLTLSKADFDLVYVNGPRLLPSAVAVKKQIPLMFHAHSLPAQRVALQTAGLALSIAGATVVCCCKYVAEGYAHWTSPDKLHVVPNGVPDARDGTPFDQHELHSPRIGVVGRIEPAKGQLLVVEAMRLMNTNVPGCEVQIWGSPGPASEAYLQAIRRAAEGLNVRVMPRTGEIAPILTGLDLLVVASANEGMPRVILEAFSAGVPVLAFSSGGVPEVVQDGETGFLVGDYSVEALAGGLIRVLKKHRADLQKVTGNARHAWERQYRSDLFRSRVADLIAQTARFQGEEPGMRRPRRHTA